jgi:hypothetical protein
VSWQRRRRRVECASAPRASQSSRRRTGTGAACDAGRPPPATLARAVLLRRRARPTGKDPSPGPDRAALSQLGAPARSTPPARPPARSRCQRARKSGAPVSPIAAHVPRAPMNPHDASPLRSSAAGARNSPGVAGARRRTAGGRRGAHMLVSRTCRAGKLRPPPRPLARPPEFYETRGFQGWRGSRRAAFAWTPSCPPPKRGGRARRRRRRARPSE